VADCWACGAPVSGGDEVVCAACGLRFSPHRAAAAHDEAYFEHYAGGAYDAQEDARRYEAAKRVQLLRRNVGGQALNKRLLEVGAAGGWFLEAAAAAGFDGFGIEPADSEAARARARGLDVRTGTIEEADLPEGELDAVCAWHVIEHIPRPLGALQRLRTALRPGGVLLVEVPNVASVTARRMGEAWPHLDRAHHVAHFTPDAMRALLERAGFERVDVSTFPGSGYVPLTAGQFVASLGEAARIGALPRRPHRWRHELIRAVAARPQEPEVGGERGARGEAGG
jgi:SAM-dependent methyltransferase